MEELIRWIFIIIFIYSILKGVFGKKKPEDNKNQPGRGIPGKGTLSSGTTVPQTSRRRSELTLEDIFGKLPENKPAEQKSEPVKKETPERYGYNYDKYSENNPFDSPVDYDRGQEVSRETIISERMKEKAAENKRKKRELSRQPETLKTEKIDRSLEPEITTNIKMMMSRPETLREMFIISEILSKPKALRK